MIIVYYSAGLLLLVEFDGIVGGAALNPLALPRSGGDLGPTFPYRARISGAAHRGSGIAQRILSRPGESTQASAAGVSL
ncbi:hypothetical_protein [Leishmania major strain Friedlin]|nr:hypothetical_protein [Leishmania major strain Friedlin]